MGLIPERELRRSTEDQDALTPEQVVGRRITRARRERGISRQEELGARLKPYLGKAWKKQAVSETERGNRKLNPTELLAFAIVLERPVGWFFLPPTDKVKLPGREVLVAELADPRRHGPLLAAEDRDIRRVLEDEQLAILNALEASRAEIYDRVLGLLAITERKGEEQ